jgi:nucleolar complex protein 2
MYMAYVRNVKFTSPTAWPMIHFMRRSLAEIFNLNHQVFQLQMPSEE